MFGHLVKKLLLYALLGKVYHFKYLIFIINNKLCLHIYPTLTKQVPFFQLQ